MLRLFNYSTHRFNGWRRMRVESMPAWPAGSLDLNTEWVATNTPNVIDVNCMLLGGESKVLPFPGERAASHDPFLLWPDNILEYFGGWPTVNGTLLQPVDLRVDGAGINAHLRARIASTRMMVVDLWIVWYPGNPWFRAEAMVTCSNPSVEDMTETLTQPLMLTFGDALVLPLGGPPGQLVPSGTMFGDGQARVIPLVFGWQRHMQGTDMDSFIAECEFAVGGHGVDTLLPDGNPVMAPTFNPLLWAESQRAETIRRIHTWDVGTTGPNKKQGDTGAQTGDQIFVGGEVMVWPQTEIIRYLGALKTANYPQHHREADGSPLDPAQHQSRPMIFWHGRPHEQLWNIVDRLGKPRPINFEAGESNGWLGMDVEHWLMNSLVAACRLFWSPACQHLLEVQARIYPLQWTVHAGWSTSQGYASRAIGYEYLNAVSMFRVLDNRALAETTLAHSHARWSTVTKPLLASTAPWVRDGFWPGRIELWQQALCAYGVDLWGRVFGQQDARDAALVAAQQVLDKGFYVGGDGKWHTYSSNLLPSGDVDPQANTIFDLFGFTCAPTVILRSPPSAYTEKAQQIRNQEVADADLWFEAQWIPPYP